MEMAKIQPLVRANPSIIKTPQSIIHIKHNVSLLAYKHWVLLLQDLREQIEADEPTEAGGVRFISMSKLSERLGYTPSKKDLWECFRSLKNQDLAINFLDKDGHKAKYGAGFISEWSITSNRIGYKFPSFLELVMSGDDEAKKIFQLLNWNIFNSFTGKYEAIIYKLCKDYIGIGRTPYMTVEDYREYIGLSDGDYPATRDFNKRCVNDPIRAINKNELSDIVVSVEFRNHGRKIEGLWFKSELKKQTQLPFEEFKQHPAFDYAKISIDPEDQTKYLEKYTPQQVQAIIERANDYAQEVKAKGKKENLSGLYKKAFIEGWGLDNLEAKREEKANKKVLIEQQKAEGVKTQQQAKTETQEAIESKKRLEAFELLSETEKNDILQAVLQQVPKVLRASIERAYKEHGVNAPAKSAQVRGMLIGYLNK
jgi:hypothetical protein